MRALAITGFITGLSIWAPNIFADENSANALPENWYVLQPWMQHPPVDVYRRVAGLQSAIGGVQSSVNSYSRAVQAQAKAHNQRVMMQAELARVEAAQAKPEARRSNFATRGTAAEIDSANRNQPLKARGMTVPATPWTGMRLTEQQAYELGVSVAELSQATNGWGIAKDAPKTPRVKGSKGR